MSKSDIITIRVPKKLKAWLMQEIIIRDVANMNQLVQGILEDYQKERTGG